MFSIPLLQNPASAIGLLFGNDVDLIKYQAPQLNVGFEFQIGIPIFPVFNITVGGQLSAIIDFAFGYDTMGIRKFAETRRPSDLLDGFFFDDRAVFDSSGNKTSDVTELTFRFAVTAGGELDLKAAKAGVQVGIGAALLLDLNDPNLDGKVRFAEIQENLRLGNAPGLGPLWVFDASGQLDAFLTAYAKAFGIRVQATLGPKVLINYDFPRPEPANPVLARRDPNDYGRLIVNVGPDSHLRNEGDTDDGDEVIFVSTNEDNQKTVITGFGTDKEFDDVTSVYIDAGNGEDEIFIDEGFLFPVTVIGGYGNDSITGGGGTLTAFGGQGDDTIFGGTGNDSLYGEGTGDPAEVDGGGFTVFFTDNDLVDGGDGDDTIIGNAGDDQLQGGIGSDSIRGGDGEDYLGGGDGDDTLEGGDHDDVLSGDNGNDVLRGEIGFDFLQGGGGSDRLEGGSENDQLFGGTGSDVLLGGSGNDLLDGAITPRDNPDFQSIQASLDFDSHTLDGGTGNDLIYGTAGVDTVTSSDGRNRVYTYESNDTITTGDDNDRVESGDGDDVIHVGDGMNEVYAGAGYDVVTSGNGLDYIDLRPKTPGLGSAFGSEVNDAGGYNRIYGDQGVDVITVTGPGDNYVDAGDGDNIVTMSSGNDTIRTGNGTDQIRAGDGNNEVTSGGGVDDVTTGTGNDNVRLGSGDDVAVTGAGSDVVLGGSGNDTINSGGFDDYVRGNEGDDVLILGLGNDTGIGDDGNDVIWGAFQGPDVQQLLGSLVQPAEYSSATSFAAFPAIVPEVLAGASVPGAISDGNDLLRGGRGFDIVFGGGGSDDIQGDSGTDYLDGGLGNDIVAGGDNSDVVRGGDGDDAVRGNDGIDFVYGDAGSDDVRGDAGNGSVQFGQKLFGGPGNDTLLAYAPTFGANEFDRPGDFLDGGAGADDLYGNTRGEVILGGLGDDNLLGDGLKGPGYGDNPSPAIDGGNDRLMAGFGDDLLLGHGGDDELWGGGNVDRLEGHAGQDSIFGGGGKDEIRFDVDPRYNQKTPDVIEGHRDDFPDDFSDLDVPDDFATDVLVIPGTEGTDQNDEIILFGADNGQLDVSYNGRLLQAIFRDVDGKALIDQFKLEGYDGNDELGFDESLDLSDLAARSRDFVGLIQGGSGDDTLTGSAGRDRIDGGRGSDWLFGFAGDDQLFGDPGNGSSLDEDRLFAGQGNDDLLGGLGSNRLYAWSRLPGAVGADYGIFVDPATGVLSDTFATGLELEDTGLNRMLGRDGDDLLYAGTGLDFMYGGEGDDILHDVNGILLEFAIGVPESEEWLEYARSHDDVWYYGGSNSDDIITVDYVTEPGLLAGHHLITRLTENNGRFTFDAQVRLDFNATNEDGTPVWNPQSVVEEIELINGIEDDDRRRLVTKKLELSGNLLPPEGDFSAIVLDAKAGDDQVYVGPTVQRTVWVSAGKGDDRVEFSGGSPILTDLADSNSRNEVLGDIADPSAAYDLGTLTNTKLFTELTLDSPGDVDWFSLTTDIDGPIGGQIVVDSLAETDQIELTLFARPTKDVIAQLGVGIPVTGPVTVNQNKRSRVAVDLTKLEILPGNQYFVRVRSLSEIPTVYDLGFDFSDLVPLGLATQNLGVDFDVFKRRDVIVGGEGDDVLRGGPSEDWVIGGPGNDVLSGGEDFGAADILIGESGDDLFQVIPAEIGSESLGEGDLTLTDEMEGGDGYDRVLYLGGDLGPLGRPVNDHVTLSYDPTFNQYELTALVWDTANQQFLADGNDYVKHGDIFRTRSVEGFKFDLRSGDDELHLEPGYFLAHLDGTLDITRGYGIAPGDRQNGDRVYDRCRSR